MMSAWFYWWWDPTLGLPRAQIALGAAALAAGIVAVFYAWRVAQKQFLVMDEQTAISKRQMELAEKQDKIIEEQLNKKTDLRIRGGGQNIKFSSATPGEPPTVVQLDVVNGGTKTADGFHWEVLIPEELVFKVRFIDDNDDEVEGDFAPFSQTEIYRKREGHWPHKLFVWGRVPVARISIVPNHPAVQQFVLKWRIRGEDGIVPKQGLAEIGFKRTSDGTYAVYNAEPGEKVNPDAPVVDQNQS